MPLGHSQTATFCLVSSNESPAPRSLPLLFVVGLSSSCLWWCRRTTSGPLLTKQAPARGCKDHAGLQALCRTSPKRKQNQARETRAISRAQCKQKRNALSMHGCVYRHAHTLQQHGLRFFKLRISLVRGDFASVRGYGLRTYKSRQGRNAATVV